MASEVKQTSILNRARRAREHTTALHKVFLANGLVGSRLVHNRSLVRDVSGWNGRADAVVLVRLPLNDGLHNVVNVVVHNLTDRLTLVNHATVSSGLSESVLRVTSDSAHESSILVSVGVHFTNGSRGNHTAVDLLGKVLRLKHRLHMVLNVVLVNVVLTLAKQFLNLVTVVDVARDRGEVLHVLVHVTSSHVHTRVDARRLRHTRATEGVGLRSGHTLNLRTNRLRLSRHTLRNRSRSRHLRGRGALGSLRSGTLGTLVVVGHKVRELFLGVTEEALATVDIVLCTVDSVLGLVGFSLRLFRVENLLNDVAHLQFKVGEKRRVRSRPYLY